MYLFEVFPIYFPLKKVDQSQVSLSKSMINVDKEDNTSNVKSPEIKTILNNNKLKNVNYPSLYVPSL